MTPERWQQIDRLLELALDQKSSERADFLGKACAGDEGLRREVEALLQAHAQAGSFIEAPALEAAARGLDEGHGDLLVGQEAGPQDRSEVSASSVHSGPGPAAPI